MAIGSDAQWRRLTGIPRFHSIAHESRVNYNGRLADRIQLHKDITEITFKVSCSELGAELAQSSLPNAPILNIPQVGELEALQGKRTTTTTPEGKQIRMQPMAIDLENTQTEFAFPPKYAEQTGSVLAEAGYSADEITQLLESGAATGA
jgi:crotonobetainyl-CoA:carnitine CoA-transferase CaiB-like acyl-CoA transferase